MGQYAHMDFLESIQGMTDRPTCVSRPERRGKPVAEPCLVDAHSSYYRRRGLETDTSDPNTYRNHMHRIPQQPKQER